MLLLGLHAGAVADRLPRKRILLTTQLLNSVATLALAAITISGAVRPADVYVFALLAGVIFAYDAPARQAFVTEVVPPARLRAAVSLNAAVFQATRLIGPAIASLLIATAGTGWVFALNAACYLGPTVGLLRLRPADLQPAAREPGAARAKATIRAAARYVQGRPDVLWTIFLVGMIGTFGLEFPIVLTAMAAAFHGAASTYGLFNIILAVGSSAGALLAGAASRPGLRAIVIAAAGFGLLQAAAAVMPGMAEFLPTIAVMGFVNLMFQAMANAYVQLSVNAELRGRVMGLYMLVFVGGAAFGAPIVGAITSHFGARAGMASCGLISVVAAVITGVALARWRRGRGGGQGREGGESGAAASVGFLGRALGRPQGHDDEHQAAGRDPGQPQRQLDRARGQRLVEQPGPGDQEVRAADDVGDGDEDGRPASLERGLVEQHGHR
jgi:MFS family permease